MAGEDNAAVGGGGTMAAAVIGKAVAVTVGIVAIPWLLLLFPFMFPNELLGL